MPWAYEGMYGAEGVLQVLLTIECQPRCSVKAKVDPLRDSTGIGAYYFSCLTSAIDGDGWSASRPGCFTPRKSTSTHCGGGCRCTVRTFYSSLVASLVVPYGPLIFDIPSDSARRTLVNVYKGSTN